MKCPRAVLVLSILFWASACGSGSGPTDPGGYEAGGSNGTGGGSSTGGGSGSGGTTGPQADPSFTTDIMGIFTRNSCTSSGCHGSGQGDLTMTTASVTYSNLVNVVSPNSGEVRVIPGNAADSYLVKKLEGRASVGAKMPLGGNSLNTTDLQNIKNWINQGAKNN